MKKLGAGGGYPLNVRELINSGPKANRYIAYSSLLYSGARLREKKVRSELAQLSLFTDFPRSDPVTSASTTKRVVRKGQLRQSRGLTRIWGLEANPRNHQYTGSIIRSHREQGARKPLGQPACGTQRACAGPEGATPRERAEKPSARPGELAGALRRRRRRALQAEAAWARGGARGAGGGCAPEPRGRAGLEPRERTAAGEARVSARGRRARPADCSPQSRQLRPWPGVAAAPGDSL